MKDPVSVVSGKVVPEVPYRPTGVRLYGVPASLVKIRDFMFKIEICRAPAPQPETAKNSRSGRSGNEGTSSDPPDVKLAVIYGYSYEGHCYSLPKPCIMAVDGEGECAVGCGYDDQAVMTEAAKQLGRTCKDAGDIEEYRMWTADKLTKTFEISITSGFIEDIVLNQNVAGPKPPAAYSAKVAMAHRGGKLME